MSPNVAMFRAYFVDDAVSDVSSSTANVFRSRCSPREHPTPSGWLGDCQLATSTLLNDAGICSATPVLIHSRITSQLWPHLEHCSAVANTPKTRLGNTGARWGKCSDRLSSITGTQPRGVPSWLCRASVCRQLPTRVSLR